MPRRARSRPFRRRSVRAAWFAVLEEKDPALAEELRELRRHNPQGYRKRLLLLSREMDLTVTSAVPKPPEDAAEE